MKTPIKAFTLTMALCGATCTHVSAALLAYEGFNYTAGSALGGLSGGTGFQAAWWTVAPVATSRVDSPGMTYAGLPDSGGKLYGAGAGTGSVLAYRDLTTTLGTDGTTTWLSFLAVRTGGRSSTNGVGGAASYVRAFNLGLFEAPTPGSTTGQAERLSPGEGTRDTAATRPDTDTWGLLVAGNAANAATRWTTSPIDVESFFLLRIDHGAANADTAYLWINPSLAAEPTTATAAATTTGNFTFNRLRPFAGNPNASSQQVAAEGYFDEIRIGTTWVDAIPEPTAFALFALGMTGLLAARPRR